MRRPFRSGAAPGQTGLYTRQAFFHHASMLLGSSPDGTYQAVVVDIHNFKQVNSIYGENVGDDIIQYLAGKLKRLVPEGLVAHYDGDSFVCLENVTAHTDAELEKAIRGIAKAAPIRNLLLKCGVYCCENASLPVSVICNRAFLALNSIKDDMNHAVARFDDPINQRICRERDMEARFEDALQNQEFVVWYQPKFDVRTERMVGAEALVRWRKQDGTVVSPGEFIPLFERDGLIIRLDEFVFRSVCRIQKKLLAQFGSVFPISVNLSRNSLHYPGMIERYARIVAEEELEAKCVPIELTESAEQQMIQIKDLAQKMVELGFPLHRVFLSGQSQCAALPCPQAGQEPGGLHRQLPGQSGSAAYHFSCPQPWHGYPFRGGRDAGAGAIPTGSGLRLYPGVLLLQAPARADISGQCGPVA